MNSVCFGTRFIAAALGLCFPSLFAAEAKKPLLTNSPVASRDKQTEYRLKWNLDTLVGDYERFGSHNPKWDESAKRGLTLFAQSRSLGDASKATESWDTIPSVIKTAITNGCNDPLVRYLHARFVLEFEPHTAKEYDEDYRLAAEGLNLSRYAPVRKFYAALRAAEALKPGGTHTPPEVHRWRRQASKYLNEAVNDKAMPPVEVFEACDQLLQCVKANAQQFEEFYKAFEPSIFTNWPAEPALYLLKGIFYTEYAWHARGGELADKVTDEGWRLFEERLAEAEKALTKAWELNPRDERIACRMITVELGQGKGRSRMELWFKRATDLNPNYYDAFDAKRCYLEPKWHGSAEDMLNFGRECVNSKKWGGRAPLILLDAHQALANHLEPNERANYWKQPEVWADIKAAFEKFFKLNPGETRWHHNYALYAYQAGQWDDLNRQLLLLGEISYEYFGGKEQYDKMVQEAKAHVQK